MTLSPTVAESTVGVAAERLAAAERAGVPCAPVRDLFAPADLAAAYAVQRVNVERGVAAGRRIVGRKTGLTSKAVQRQLGVDQPDFGALFADMCVADGDEIPARRLLQPKVEAEVALVLGADLPDPRTTVVDVLRVVEFALPALEIVDSRVAGWDITIVDTVADNASCGLFVLGATPVPLDRVDLRTVEMRLSRGEDVVSRGTGADCLGGPLNATVWLAATLAAAGDPLRAGDVVLTGALGPMVAAVPGDVFETEITGLGSARTRFASAPVEGDQQ
ncbi:2-keto-4-pentenoate hydratase [Frankia sp. AgB1.9]|uniref:2-keto-4-pentenoate hydratase n=1 Tax=unclassified Frankia TaxID=2632575 RepID=UPI001934A6FD|nr:MULTISPECIES: 2-keto-4-pentenoate hydratase [unclassified Frankia]MBL7487653.1 2-keto-4-pentenoate hydratase [Frankia sp. AgW1.1]MBL7550031.1 2-keto-4-pentenoate hydratase [Frankia sp. AgB1.9]MBL7621904.1 2-keto-4-pentenoate hydratase [Frankia sp. AgB1.8]